MSKQWGSGFYAGKEQGEYWGALLKSGEWEINISEKTDKLQLLVNALRFPCESSLGRNEIWWQLYVSIIAREIESILRTLPGTFSGIYEFEKDIPNEKHE